jgi:hypothetical protein
MRGIFAGICKVVILRAPLLLTLAECSGVLMKEGRPCKKALNKGVNANCEGNVVLMK